MGRAREATGAPIYLEKHHVTGGAQTIVVRVPERPDRVAIDPYAKMIDRNLVDNFGSVTAN